MQLLPGSQLGVYVLESLLGSGAFGVVWLAKRTDNGERVAIKVMHPEAAVSRESVERFRREAWALSQLQSPHIARMFEFLTGPPFGMALVMEYIEGELLSDVLLEQPYAMTDSTVRDVQLFGGA